MITAQGIGSGLDVASIVSQLVAAEGQPASLRLARREASVQSELSALGSLKSTLSTFRDALNKLSDIDVFRSRKATSGNEDLFRTSAGSDAVPSAYEVEILSVATTQKLASAAVADADETQLGAGQLILRSGPEDEDAFGIVIAEDASTLTDIRDSINNNENNRSVRASIVQAEDGARLIVTGTRTGEDYEITIETGAEGGLEALTYGPDAIGSTMSELRGADNARIKVDTFERISSSNVFTDVIDGVSINVVGAEPGTLTTLEVEYDTAAATDKASDFVDAYNALVDSLANLTRFDADSGDAGPLLGDRSVRDVVGRLRRELAGGGTLGDGSYRSLTRAGITTELDGKMSIDNNLLRDELETDFDSIARLFASEDGFAQRLDAVLEPFIGSGGQLDKRTDGLKESIELIGDQRTALDRRLASVEARYFAQFSALDSIVSTLTSTSNFLAQQLSSLPSNFIDR
jgi:flagellar hook-associated protein 2